MNTNAGLAGSYVATVVVLVVSIGVISASFSAIELTRGSPDKVHSLVAYSRYASDDQPSYK